MKEVNRPPLSPKKVCRDYKVTIGTKMAGQLESFAVRARNKTQAAYLAGMFAADIYGCEYDLLHIAMSPEDELSQFAEHVFACTDGHHNGIPQNCGWYVREPFKIGRRTNDKGLPDDRDVFTKEDI